MVNKGLIEMSVQYKDYYEILGVSRTAPADEIRRAYRKLAKQYHPDVCKEKDAEARYKEINEAYEVLKDPDKRQKYDTLGMNWQAGQDFTPPPGWQGGGMPGGMRMEFGGDMGGFSDFFKTLFGGGGLGDLAIRYGYQRFRPEVMLATVVVLIVLVQLVQFIGNTLAKKLDKR